MKTRYFLFITVLLLSFKLYSQQDKIIYTQFDKEECQFFKDVPEEGYCLDLDGDSVCDFVTIGGVYNVVSPMTIGFRALNSEWELTNCFRCIDVLDTVNGPGWALPVLEQYNDTRLDTVSRWYTRYWWGPYVFFIHPTVDTTISHLMYGFRREIPGNDTEKHYCYGWLECSNRWNYSSPGKDNQHDQFTQAWLCVNRMAYCTITDYPLHVGQTSITGIDGNETTTLVSLHPNPTTGVVRIEGEKACEVQVYNALGQLVKTVQNTNEVSLEGQPQGVYLLRVTLEGGKVFSDKVVKE